MRIVVSDSSSLIDIKKGGLLEAFLKLPYELVVPESMLVDELLSFTKGETTLMRKKMTLGVADADQMTRVHAKQARCPALTVYDCIAFVLADEEEDAVLLTGDRRLRETANLVKIECHGVLWVVEELSKAKLATPKNLRVALEIWREDTLVRLPKADLHRAILRHRKR